MEKKTNGKVMQEIFNDTLFASPESVSDIKQVLEIMRDKGQALREEQIQALILLQQMGENKMLHPDGNPYAGIIKEITGKYKIAVVNPAFYLDTIEELVPKPPKPIILTERGKPVTVHGNR